ncbi:oligosaccharide flippase family protein [Ralstonia mannitolilytica]|uniref:oligosaccharide flippase family protein n=1 Tax=Ralstonia mannitolilytica TaxID=105219 RepID=UPI003B83E9EB
MTSVSRHSSLLKNIVFLLLAQGSNYVVPLITLPVLVSRLKPEGFGVIAFAQALAVYIQLLADYGFSTSATRHIAIYASSPVATLREYVSTIHACKFLLVFAVSTLALPVLYLWSGGGESFIAGLLMMGGAIGNALTPLWYYQGINNMKVVAIATGLSKWAGAVAIFIFVRGPSDVLFAVCAYSIPPLVVAIVFTFNLRGKGLFELAAVDFRTMVRELRVGAPFFLTSAGAGVLANSSVIVLGLFFPASLVGVYAAAEKIIRAAVGCMAPISQSVYPVNAANFAESPQEGFRSVRKTATWLLLPAVIGTALLYIATPRMLDFLHWTDPRYTSIIRYLCPWIVLGVINNVLGVQILSAMGRGRAYAHAFLLAALGTLLIMFVFTPVKAEMGVVMGMLGGELILTMLLIFSVRSIVRELHSH